MPPRAAVSEVSYVSSVDLEAPPAIAAELRGQRTLEDVVRWGLARDPPLVVAEVVVQDEYTHDVVMPHPSGVWLVYDTT